MNINGRPDFRTFTCSNPGEEHEKECDRKASGRHPEGWCVTIGKKVESTIDTKRNKDIKMVMEYKKQNKKKGVKGN